MSDETRQFSPDDDDDDRTRVQPRQEGDETIVTPTPPGVTQPGATPPGPARPDATSVMPNSDWQADDKAWAGRAQVRPPRPSREVWTTTGDEWAPADPREPRGKWWMPIVLGIVGLVLLGALGWGIYLIASAEDGTGDPATPPSAQQAPTVQVPTTEATRSTAPTTTPPTTATTTNPTGPTAVTVPALVGLSQQEAQQALERRGLSSRTIQRPSDNPPGTVIDSDPAEGQEVPPDTQVTLVIATEPRTTTPAASPATTTPGQD